MDNVNLRQNYNELERKYNTLKQQHAVLKKDLEVGWRNDDMKMNKSYNIATRGRHGSSSRTGIEDNSTRIDFRNYNLSVLDFHYHFFCVRNYYFIPKVESISYNKNMFVKSKGVLRKLKSKTTIIFSREWMMMALL